MFLGVLLHIQSFCHHFHKLIGLKVSVVYSQRHIPIMRAIICCEGWDDDTIDSSSSSSFSFTVDVCLLFVV